MITKHAFFRLSVPPAFAIVVLCSLVAVEPAFSNDSTVTLGAGGLQMTKTDALRINSEKLSLSTSLVRVDYEIENVTDKPVETLVAFPMPKQSGAELVNVPVTVPDNSSENFVHFQVTVDGKRLEPELEARAFLLDGDQHEVTEQLRPLGLLTSPVREDFYAKLEALPEAARKQLEDAKLLEVERSDPAHLGFTPLWELRTTYFWKQTFPAKTVSRVHHEYSPVVGRSLFGAYSFEDERDKWCIDAPTEQAIRALIKKQQPYEGGERYLARSQVDYVLHTGANWAGPMKSFELTIDKGAPENIVSLCLNGLEKTSPTTFILRRSNFVPDGDLSLLLLAPVNRKENVSRKERR